MARPTPLLPPFVTDRQTGQLTEPEVRLQPPTTNHLSSFNIRHQKLHRLQGLQIQIHQRNERLNTR